MTTTEPPPILGETSLDPIGVILGTGYHRFHSPAGVHGLAKWEGDRLDILAVSALKPGTGQFRDFIREAKTQFAHIYVWEVWNKKLLPVLERYGFTPTTQTDDGEKLSGFHWSKGDSEINITTPLATTQTK